MSGPSWCSTSFDLAAAPRSCSRSKVPTLGMSLSMTNLRSAMATSHKQRPHEFLNYEAFGLGAIRDSLTRQSIPLRSSVIRETDSARACRPQHLTERNSSAHSGSYASCQLRTCRRSHANALFAQPLHPYTELLLAAVPVVNPSRL